MDIRIINHALAALDPAPERRMQLDLRSCIDRYLNAGFEIEARNPTLILRRGIVWIEILHSGAVTQGVEPAAYRSTDHATGDGRMPLANKITLLNSVSERHAEAAIQHSAAGEHAQAIRANIRLLREHMRYYAASLDGRERERRALATIANLEAQLAELQETTP